MLPAKILEYSTTGFAVQESRGYTISCSHLIYRRSFYARMTSDTPRLFPTVTRLTVSLLCGFFARVRVTIIVRVEFKTASNSGGTH